MKRIYNYLLVLAVPALIVLFYAGTNSTNGSPGGKTGSPGDNNQNCTGCHIGTPVQQDLWIFIPELLPNQGYIPGTTYNVLVYGTREGSNKFGFEATAEKENGDKVGTFALLDPVRTKLTNGNQAVTHTQTGTISPIDSTAWIFTWTAPAESQGAITFYAAINGSNANNANSGDIINLSSFTVSPGVGYEEIKSNQFAVYPNPATDFFSVSKPGSTIEIINSKGAVELMVENASAGQKIDISGLAKGMYFVKSGKTLIKLVKN